MENNTISLCPHCLCMTKKINGKCGKCGGDKMGKNKEIEDVINKFWIDWEAESNKVYTKELAESIIKAGYVRRDLIGIDTNKAFDVIRKSDWFIKSRIPTHDDIFTTATALVKSDILTVEE